MLSLPEHSLTNFFASGNQTKPTMRRILLFVLAISASLLATSCLTFEEVVKFNKDGSGTHTLTIDMSEMMSNPFMQGALEEEGGADMTTDSTWTKYAELAPLNPQWTAAEAALVKRNSGRMYMNGEEGEAYVVETFEFDDISQLREYNDLIARSNKPVEDDEEEDDGNPLGGLTETGDGGFLNKVYTYGKGKFSVVSTADPSDDEEEDEDEDMLGMMESMFEDASYTYIVEFAGKVKKVKGFPGHELDGNRLIVEIPFLEMINDEEAAAERLNGSVKFKN